jgi:hypothetical protein
MFRANVQMENLQIGVAAKKAAKYLFSDELHYV